MPGRWGDCLSVLGNPHGWLKRDAVNRATPRQSFGFGFVGNARLNECMMARLGKFHRIPLALLADGIHRAHFSVDRHSIDHPQQRFLLSHLAPSPPQKTVSLPSDS